MQRNEAVAENLKTYLESNSPEPWNEKLEFVPWAIGYLNENRDVDFVDLIKGDNTRFIMDLNTQNNYPRFTSIVKELRTFVKNDQKVMAALVEWSGFKETQILEKLEFGKGPKIVVKDLVGSYGYFSKSENPNIIN